jgi:hypothetical protein
MKKLAVAVFLLWPLAAVHEAGASEKIGAITNAGITCSGQLPPRIARRFVEHAKRACEDRVRCFVRATSAAGQRRLARYACTNYFVVAKCDGVDREFRSKRIRGTMRIRC